MESEKQMVFKEEQGVRSLKQRIKSNLVVLLVASLLIQLWIPNAALLADEENGFNWANLDINLYSPNEGELLVDWPPNFDHNDIVYALSLHQGADWSQLVAEGQTKWTRWGRLGLPDTETLRLTIIAQDADSGQQYGAIIRDITLSELNEQPLLGAWNAEPVIQYQEDNAVQMNWDRNPSPIITHYYVNLYGEDDFFWVSPRLAQAMSLSTVTPELPVGYYGMWIIAGGTNIVNGIESISGSYYGVLHVTGEVEPDGDGLPPYWPEHAELTLDSRTTNSLTVGWPQAEDDIVRYRIWLNGVEQASVNAEVRQYTLDQLAPGQHYEVAITAEDFDGVSSEQLAGTFQTESASMQLNWSSALAHNGAARYLIVGEDMQLEMRGDAGYDAEAQVSYQSWLNDDGQPTEQLFHRQLTIPLAESQAEPGMYRGSFTLAEQLAIAEVTELAGLLRQDGIPRGNPVEIEMGLRLTGSIHIELQPGGGAISPVSITLESGDDRHIATATEPGMYTFHRLLPDTSYRAVARQVDGGRILREWQTDSVRSSKSMQDSVSGIRSASIQVVVKDHSGEPAANATIIIARPNGSQIKRAATDELGEAGFDGLSLLENDQVFVSVTFAPAHTLNKPQVPATLLAGDNRIEIVLDQRPQVRYYGVVRHRDEPLSSFPLTFSQTHPTRPGERVIQHVMTDSSGFYQVYLYEGLATVEGASFDHSIPKLQRQVGNTDAEWNLPAGVNSEIDIHYTIMTKMPGGDWVTKEGAQLTAQERAAYMPFLYDQRGRLIRQSNTYPLKASGEEGDVFRLCMENTRYNLMSSCQEVGIDALRQGHAYFQMEITGGQVAAQFEQQLRDGSWIMTITEEEGRFNRIYSVAADGVWQDHLPYSGNYVLTLSQPTQVQQQICIVCSVMPRPASPGETAQEGGKVIEIPFTVPNGGGVDLGMLGLSSGSLPQQTQGLLIRSSVLTPGASFDMRLAVSPEQLPHHDQLTVKLRLPELTTLEPSSLMLGGKPLDASQWLLEDEGRLLLVQAGQLAVGEPLLIHARLELDMDYTAAEAVFHVEGVFGDGLSEQVKSLGQQRVPVRHIIMDAPLRTINPATDIFGWAIPGSTVSVYHEQHLLGQTAASSEGSWSMGLQLPASSTDFIYILSAAAELDGQVWMADSKAVHYRKNAPYIESIRMSSDGSNRYFYPTRGVSRFPYTVNFGLFEFDVIFNDPDLVSGVSVRIGGSVLQTVYNEATKSYTAATIVGYNNIHRFNGPIYVSYNEVPRASSSPSPIYNEQQLRAALPWWMKDLELPQPDEVIVDSQPNEETRQLTLRIPGLGDDAVIDTTFTVQTGIDYDFAGKPRMSGHDMSVYGYGAEFIKGENYESPFADPVEGWRDSRQMLLNFITQPKSADSSFVIRVQTYHEYDNMQSLAAAGSKQEGRVQTLALPPLPYGQAAMVMADSTIKSYDFYASTTGVEGFLGVLDELDKAIQHAYAACSVGAAQGYHSEMENIMEDAMLGEVGKVAAMGAGTAAGVLLPGAGLLATGLIFGSTYFYGKILDKAIADRVKNVKDRMQQDEDCNKEEEEPEPRKKEPVDDLVADPEWIYDPSGYVYETVAEDRLSDVLATLFYKDAESGEWIEWDAEWYGQINPQWTDVEGKYGWDVPQGLWQVRYEKFGYETAYSEPLTVLPPHFDVNIPMVSLQSPEAARAYSDNGGLSLHLSFTKYMSVESFELYLPSLQRNEETIAGIWQPVDPVSLAGRQLARSFSFSPFSEGQLQTGDVLELEIDRRLSGYNDLPVAGPLVFTAAVTATDEHPPAAPKSLMTSAGDREIYVAWRDPQDKDLDRIAVEWRIAGQGPYQSMEIDKGVRFAIIRNIAPHMEYDIRLSALDEQGNASSYAEITGSAGEALHYAGDVRIPHVTEASILPRANALEVNWKEPSGSGWQEVRINWRDATDDGAVLGTRVSKGTQSLVIGDLIPGQQYDVTLIVEDEAGNESNAVKLQASPSKPAPPAAPIIGAGSPDFASPDETIAWRRLGAGNVVSMFEDSLLVRMASGQHWVEREGGLRIVKRDQAARQRDERYWSGGYAYEFHTESAGQSGWPGPLHVQLKVDGQSQAAVDVHKLALYRLEDEVSEQWTYVGGAWNAGSERLEAQIAREGVYAVFAFQPIFRDVQRHWAQDQIERLAAHHIIAGIGEGYFAPERSITRAEMAALLVRRLERDAGAPIVIANGVLSGYHDVEADEWHATVLQKAASIGLMIGSDGYMRPDDFLTREEAAVLTLRAIELLFDGSALDWFDAGPEAMAFADGAEIAEWARESVQTLAKLGIVQGFPSGAFAPKNVLSRAQAASLLWEMHQMHN